jgi:hypothetical protein
VPATADAGDTPASPATGGAAIAPGGDGRETIHAAEKAAASRTNTPTSGCRKKLQRKNMGRNLRLDSMVGRCNT